MDFVMMRPDYDKLRHLINEGLAMPKPYYFDNSSATVIKLRCENTCMLNKNYKLNENFDQSVWVDIFCLDEIPINDTKYAKKYKKIVRLITIGNNKRLHSFTGTLKQKLFHLFCLPISVTRTQQRAEMIIKQNGQGSDYVSNVLVYSIYYSYDRLKKFNKHWFNEIIDLPFEDTQLPCPKDYEKILDIEYGDWRTPVKGASLHQGLIVDLNKSYKDVVNDILSRKSFFSRLLYKY